MLTVFVYANIIGVWHVYIGKGYSMAKGVIKDFSIAS